MINLDFSALQDLGKNNEKTPEKKRLDELIKTLDNNSINEEQSATDNEKIALNKLQRQANINLDLKEQALSVYQEYQKNRTLAVQLKAEILKGVTAGEELKELFLKETKLISLLLNDPLFYDQITADLNKQK